MRINQSEIIDDFLEHIRQSGGNWGEWCVGTARTMQNGEFKIQDGKFKSPEETENGMPNLAYREAFTPYAAAEVVDYLKGLRLHPDPQSTRGCYVFIYHLAAAGPPRKAALSALP